MFLECRKKLEYLEKDCASEGRTWKLQSEKSQLGFEPSGCEGDSPNQTVLLIFDLYFLLKFTDV